MHLEVGLLLQLQLHGSWRALLESLSHVFVTCPGIRITNQTRPCKRGYLLALPARQVFRLKTGTGAGLALACCYTGSVL